MTTTLESLEHFNQVEANELRLILSQLPDVPTDPHEFGEVIENTKRIIFLVNRQISDLKETTDRIRKAYSDSVRDGKATLSEKDKREIAALCEDDENLKNLEDSIRWYTEAAAKWDARASRLRRDFEVAVIDYQKAA